MTVLADKRSSAAAQARRVVDEVLNIAHSSHAAATVSGGSKPHVTIMKNVTDYNETYFRALLAGIEFATHGHFAQGRDTGTSADWELRGRLVDVTIRAVKGL